LGLAAVCPYPQLLNILLSLALAALAITEAAAAALAATERLRVIRSLRDRLLL